MISTQYNWCCEKKNIEHCDCTVFDSITCYKVDSLCIWNQMIRNVKSTNYNALIIQQELIVMLQNVVFGRMDLIKYGGCKDFITSLVCKQIDNCYQNKNKDCASFSKCNFYTIDICPFENIYVQLLLDLVLPYNMQLVQLSNQVIGQQSKLNFLFGLMIIGLNLIELYSALFANQLLDAFMKKTTYLQEK